MIYDGRGEPGQAVAWLEKDFAQHSAELQMIMFRTQFDRFRRDARVAGLIRRMGLTP